MLSVQAKGGNFIYPMMLRAKFLSSLRGGRAFEGFEGDFQRPEFQDAAHPRYVSMSPINLWYVINNVKWFHGHFTYYCSRLRPC